MLFQKSIRLIFIYLIIVSMVSCSSNFEVNPQNKSQHFEKIEEASKKEKIKVLTKGYKYYLGKNAYVKNENLFFYEVNQEKEISIPLKDIEQVFYESRSESIKKGFLIGTIPGLAIGLFVAGGVGAASDFGDSISDDEEEDDNGEGPLLLVFPILGGLSTGGIGALIGVNNKSEMKYDFALNQNSLDADSTVEEYFAEYKDIQPASIEDFTRISGNLEKAERPIFMKKVIAFEEKSEIREEILLQILSLTLADKEFGMDFWKEYQPVNKMSQQEKIIKNLMVLNFEENQESEKETIRILENSDKDVKIKTCIGLQIIGLYAQKDNYISILEILSNENDSDILSAYSRIEF